MMKMQEKWWLIDGKNKVCKYTNEGVVPKMFDFALT
jgi:hypothetical protein